MSVLAYIEPSNGTFKKSALELISYGKGIARQLDTTLDVMVLGQAEDTALSGLATWGADQVMTYDATPVFDARNIAAQVAALASGRAKVILFQHNTNGKALAPRVAYRLKAGVVSGASGLPVTTDPLVIPKKVYTGKASGHVRIDSETAVVTLSQNSYGMKEEPGGGKVEAGSLAADLPPVVAETVDVNKLDGKLLLTDAEIVVSGGRGMRGSENWGLLEDLAGVLGAALACSRPVSDEGWRPHHEHVGQTGKIIAPNIYIAAGISGAIQHIAGVSGTRCLVAINKDPEAPVFEVADYGIVGDVMEVLPKLVESFKAFRAAG